MLYVGESTKADKQAVADRLLTRIEQAKNRGEDYNLADILNLRAVCQVIILIINAANQSNWP